MKHSRLLFLGVVVFLASCDDGTGPDGAAAAGTVTFNYTGAGGGSYDVTGAIPLNQNALFTTSWSVGAREDTEGQLVVMSVRAQSGGNFDEVLMTIPRLTPGSATIETCTSANCPTFSFVLGANENNDAFSFLCALETGTLSIATISSSRVTGSFSGTGTCSTPGADESTFIVSGGSFDVALAGSSPI